MQFSGQKVFYAVSPLGRVIMKPAAAMTGEENALVEVKKRGKDKISVPVDKIDLKQEEGFKCGKYIGNVENYMNSVAIVEQPEGRTYLMALMSSVLRRNSAIEH